MDFSIFSTKVCEKDRNRTYSNLSWEWNEVPKCNGMQVDL